MRLSDKDLDNMPSDREGAFMYLEQLSKEEYELRARNDKDHNTNEDGRYFGSFEPEWTYVSDILACLDELILEIDVPDITDIFKNDWDKDQDIMKEFNFFRQRVNYIVSRFRIRRARMYNGSAGTPVSIKSNYKEEIGNLLNTIRKIVNQQVVDDKKKEAIFKKIVSLQLEVDRDRTTIDVLFGNMLDFTKTLGECTDNLEPLLEKVERLKKLIWDNVGKVDALPEKERPKLIESPSNELDDDIPF